MANHRLLQHFISAFVCGRKLEQCERKEEQKIRQTAGISVILTAAFILCITNFRKFDQNLEITLLDVGQGDCIYIRTPSNKHLLVDGGSTDLKTSRKISDRTVFVVQGSKSIGLCDDYTWG